MYDRSVAYVPWLMRRNHCICTGLHARSFWATSRRELIIAKSDTIFVMPEERMVHGKKWMEEGRKKKLETSHSWIHQSSSRSSSSSIFFGNSYLHSKLYSISFSFLISTSSPYSFLVSTSSPYSFLISTSSPYYFSSTKPYPLLRPLSDL